MSKNLTARSVVASAIEALEGRRLMARQPFGFYGDPTTLVINGTAADDLISIQTRGPRTLVRLNGVPAQFTTAGFTRIQFNPGDGNDLVDLLRSPVPVSVSAGAGDDKVWGSVLNDTLLGEVGNDTLYGNAGDDRFDGGDGDDFAYGGGGADIMYSGQGNNFMNGEGGKDHLFGADGADTLMGGAGNDGIYGEAGADRIYGEAGNDQLGGNGGNDRVFGGDGADNVSGGPGSDYIYGEAGDDTLDAADNVADKGIDGGDGADTAKIDASLESALNVESVVDGGVVVPPVDPVDPNPPAVGGSLARAVSFGDEALWDENYQGLITKLKALNVNTVRVWCEVSNFTERPKAYDNITDAQLITNWRKTTTEDKRFLTAGLAMRRAFDLKAAGFKVIMTVTHHNANPPTAQQTSDYFNYLVNATKTASSTTKLKDVVDFWEVDQEVDLASNWKPSGVNKTAGLQQYVNDVLLPASAVLHSGTDPDKWEKVISSSVSFSATDLSTILTQLQTVNRLDAIDYAGYHPYGIYNETTGVDQMKDRVLAAVKVSRQFNKPLAATEWNVRGYDLNGGQDAQWADSVKKVYAKYISPYFGIAVYYNIIDNYAARGGNTTSARPAGLFSHTYVPGAGESAITPDSSTAQLNAYYDSSLVNNSPFYEAFASLDD